MLAWLSSLSWPKRWTLIGSALVGIFLLGVLVSHSHLRSPFGPQTAKAIRRPRRRRGHPPDRDLQVAHR
jgi:hypothetical protein